MFMSLSSVNGLLSRGDSVLRRLAARTGELAQLTARVEPLIPASLRHHVQVTGLDQGTLTLTVSDAARATRARLLGPTIVQALKDQPGPAVSRVRVRVMRGAMAAPGLQPGRRPRNPIPPEAAQLLRGLAGDGEDALSRALRRLAERSSPPRT